MEDIKSIVNIALLGFVGFLALVGMLKGLRRGIKRQTVRTITIILSIVLSFIAVKVLYSTVLGIFEGTTMAELFVQLEAGGIPLDQETKDLLANFDPVVIEYILAIPLALLVGPILFVPVFIVISAVMLIIHAIVSGILGFRKKENTKGTRLLGMLLGFIQGVLVSVVLLVPVLGLANIVSGTVDTIRAKEVKSDVETELLTMYDEDLKDIIENPTIKTLGALGGNLTYNALATIKVEDNRVDMTEQIDTVLVVYNEIDSFGSMDFMNLTAEQQDTIRNLINVVCDSNYFAPLLSNVAKGAATTLEGTLAAEMQEPIKTLVVDILAIFKTSSQATLKSDLNTFCDFFFYLTNRGVLASATGGSGNPDAESEDIMTVLFKTDDSNGKTTIDNAIAILDSNERTKPIISSLVKISVAYAKESLKNETGSLPEIEGVEIEQIYDDVKAGINEIVQINPESYATEEEYKEAVSDSLESFVVNNGFVDQAEIDANRESMDEVFSVVSDHIIENFGGQTEVSDAELISVVLQYYNSYLNDSGNGEVPEIPEIPEIPGYPVG